jgi:dihydrofolate reductase
VTEASKLKQQLADDIIIIIIAASSKLVRTLMSHDLADELRLMIYPFVLGSGERLIAETSDKLYYVSSQPDRRQQPRLPHLPARSTTVRPGT